MWWKWPGAKPYRSMRYRKQPMTAYKQKQTPQSLSEAARQAKAKRQAVLERVRKQRAAAQKRTAQEWMQEGSLIRASELKKQYGA